MLAVLSLQELIAILQIAVGPVILISGVGLLLLSMTSRFGRVIDRSRQMASVLRSASGADRERALAQVRILMTRARVVRRAIVLATLSVLFAAVLVITLFIAEIVAWSGGAGTAAILFVLCLACLIGSLASFLQDINMSLAALKLELAHEI